MESLCLYQLFGESFLEEDVSWIIRACSLLVKKSEKQLWSIYVAAGNLRRGLQKRNLKSFRIVRFDLDENTAMCKIYDDTR